VFFLTSMGLTYFSAGKTEHRKGVMATQPAEPEKSLPSQIPATAPAPGQPAPAAKSALPADPGSKAQDVPK
jgi:hypothetical protein